MFFRRQTNQQEPDYIILKSLLVQSISIDLISMKEMISYVGPDDEDFVQIIKHRREDITFRYQRGRLLGKGGFGQCYQARKYEGVSTNQDINEVLVIKRQIKRKEDNRDPNQKNKGIKKEQYRNEVRINKILNTVSNFYFPKYKTYWQDDKYYYTVLQKIELGALDSLYKEKYNLSDDQIVYFIRQVLKGIHLMHKEKIMHCDLKGSNILVNKQMEIKIIDFGLSEKGINSDPTSTKKSGTPSYMAPEILREQTYSYPVDIWAIGILLHYMIFGSAFFGVHKGLKPEQLLDMLSELSGNSKSLNKPKSVQIMKQMLTYDPSRRPTANQLLNHKVFSNLNINDIKRSLITKYSKKIKQIEKNSYKWQKEHIIKQDLYLKQQHKVKILQIFRHEDYGYFYILSNGLIRAYFNDQQDIVFKEKQEQQANLNQKEAIMHTIFEYTLQTKRNELEIMNKIKNYKNKEQPNCKIVSLVQTNGNIFIRLSNGTLQVLFNPRREVKEDNFYSYDLIVSINNHKHNIMSIQFQSDEGDFYFKNFDQISYNPEKCPANIDYKKIQHKYINCINYIKKVMKVMVDNSQLNLQEYGCERNYGQKK